MSKTLTEQEAYLYKDYESTWDSARRLQTAANQVLQDLGEISAYLDSINPDLSNEKIVHIQAIVWRSMRHLLKGLE